jgi:hypothetical protein
MEYFFLVIGDGMPSVEELELVEAHAKEIERVGAEAYNFGSAQTDTGIRSKTSKGPLDSERRADGTIVHTWEDEHCDHGHPWDYGR